MRTNSAHAADRKILGDLSSTMSGLKTRASVSDLLKRTLAAMSHDSPFCDAETTEHYHNLHFMRPNSTKVGVWKVGISLTINGLHRRVHKLEKFRPMLATELPSPSARGK